MHCNKVNQETNGGAIGLAFLGAKALGKVGKLAIKNRGSIKKAAKKGLKVAQKNQGKIQQLGEQAMNNLQFDDEEMFDGNYMGGKRRSRSRSRKGRKARKSRSRSRSRKSRKGRKSRSRSRKVTARYASNVAARRRARALKMM